MLGFNKCCMLVGLFFVYTTSDAMHRLKHVSSMVGFIQKKVRTYTAGDASTKFLRDLHHYSLVEDELELHITNKFATRAFDDWLLYWLEQSDNRFFKQAILNLEPLAFKYFVACDRNRYLFKQHYNGAEDIVRRWLEIRNFFDDEEQQDCFLSIANNTLHKEMLYTWLAKYLNLLACTMSHDILKLLYKKATEEQQAALVKVYWLMYKTDNNKLPFLEEVIALYER